ncbi:MAG: L,D-transpeptidase family protein [Anaerolineales bacterium]|jgi:lipoprotein-anchoring transpeptidase ErfK/SrfK
MASQSIQPSQALNQAINALHRGDKHAARTWAQIAAALAPDMEEPWLILAAVAKPHACIAYLERALEINPESKRARAGLVWAHQQTQPVRRAVPSASAQTGQPTRIASTTQSGQSAFQIPAKARTGSRILVPILLVILVVCLIAVGAFWPVAGTSVSAAILGNPGSSQDSQILSWLPAGMAKPTDTPFPTAISTLIATPSPTPFPPSTSTSTPEPTDPATPTSTATALPTVTPLPTVMQPAAAQEIPEGGEKLIVVSISQQHVYAYQGGVLVYSFVASTGSGNSTRTGTFSILDKIPKAYGSTWNFWMPDWMGIYYAGGLEDGFHSLPLLNNGQRLWGNSLGTPVTYGCIVLGIQDSKTLYDWAEIGTTVQIKR